MDLLEIKANLSLQEQIVRPCKLINKGLSFVKFTEYAAADLFTFAVLYHHGFAVDIDGFIGVDDKFELVRARVYLLWHISEKYRFWRALRIKRSPLKLAYEGAK